MYLLFYTCFKMKNDAPQSATDERTAVECDRYLERLLNRMYVSKTMFLRDNKVCLISSYPHECKQTSALSSSPGLV